MKKVCLSALFSALFCASLAFGQSASVTGTVTDPSGAQVAGAKVTAVNADTGVATGATSNDTGLYAFPSLQPGKYTVTAERTGFRKAAISDITLQIGSQVSVNLGLELGQTSETVEVSATVTAINATSATVGDVVTGKQLQDLPLTGRSAYGLLNTQPGVVGTTGTNFYLNGNQGNAINYTMDGINAQNNLLTGSFYNYSNVASVDRIEEMRVVTSPADAEYGRGSGQVQMVTRGGGGTFRGAVFEELRNTAFNANDFFNNTRGQQRNILIQNNYGVRFGGPLKKNRTFFNGIYEPYKQRSKNSFSALSYTASARQGIFRYNPGVLNSNAAAATPSVDFSGNPLNSATLQSARVFGVDPNRLAFDPTGALTKQLALTPLPNDFRLGDGLNTAGYTWNRPVPIDFGLYEGRIDHILNDQHRLTMTLNHQAFASINVAAPPPFPTAPWQVNPTETTQYSFTFTSVLRANLINEFKAGVYRPRTTVLTPFNEGDVGPVSHKDILNVKNGTPYVMNFAGAVTNPIGGNQSDYIAPNYQWGNTTTWIKGKHSFKGGVEIRFIGDSGYDANNVVPIVTLGANGAVPVQGISTLTGIGNNAAAAQNLLLDLSGSVIAATQTNNSPGGTNPKFLPGETRYREWHQNEASFFFKDDFKIRPNITLNLGVRYELYLRPTEGQGKALAPVGGSGAAFGISGNSMGALFQPGVLAGTQTLIQNIGAGTAHPDVELYHTDRNNFAPALGIAWSLAGSDRLRWLTGKKDQTTIRAGYGIGYQRIPIYLTHNDSGFEPGFSSIDQSTTATNLSNLILPVPPAGAVLSAVPFVGVGSHTQNLYTLDPNFRTPYIQNMSLSVQRQLPGDTSLTVSYVGSLGRKLPRSMDMNEVNVLNNGLLEAFKVVQAGGKSPLIDQIFNNLPNAANAAVVAANGGGSSYVTSAAAAATTQSFFANNNPGGFANFINVSNFGTGLVGGLIPNAKLPSNLVVVNPQFAQSYLTGNWGNSTYHSLQVSATRRFGKGLSLQGSYVFSKTLGEDDGQSSTYVATYRSLRNAHLDKALLSFDRTNAVKINSIYELPFGKGKLIGKNSNGFIDRIIGGWQMGSIFNYSTGAPLTITGQNTFNNTTISAGFTPNLVGALPQVEVTKLPGYVTLFPGLTQVADPNRPTLAALNGRSTLFSWRDANGLVFTNAGAGQIGTLGLGVVRAPATAQLDLNIKKRIKINERFSFVLGATATNVTNHVVFAAPTAANLNINSTSFGRSTSTANGPRILVVQGRIDF